MNNTTTVHTPHGAPPTDYDGPKRALILAGGGLRLSYQAGAIKALLDAGLCFTHIDGTSGGSLNLAQLLSGLSPQEMCHRWSTLDMKDTLSIMPLKDYLQASKRVAMGDADGMRKKVYPHLGIDFDKIHAARGLEASFNVLNYNRKVTEVISYEQIDEDMLVAGMSLPGVFPPVRKGATLYLDTAFVQDANLMEAVRRGAEEIWLIWGLGNTGVYRGGSLNIYVQMLEMSANGALNIEFERIREINARIEAGEPVGGRTRPIRLHLVKPRYPLPLDPDLYLGSVTHATLVAMGYADAKQYLSNLKEEGLPFEPETITMETARLGITFRETMSGGFALGETDPETGAKKGKREGHELAMHASITIRDINSFADDPKHLGEIHGSIDFTPFGEGLLASSGIFNLFSPTENPDMKYMVYELGFEHEGQAYYVAGKKEVHDDPGFDLWSDTTTLLTTLHKGNDTAGEVVGAGVLSLGVKDLMKLVSTMRATNADSAKDKATAYAKFGGFFLGDLWDSYKRFVKSD